MHIKRYEASTMPEAIAQVRKELGSEALILQTRQIRREGVFGMLAKPVVEVTAAVDRDHRAAEAHGTTPQNASQDRGWREIQIARTLIDPIESEVKAVRRSVDALTVGGDEPLTIAVEIAELRQMVADLKRPHMTGARPYLNAFLAAGLEPRHAFTLAAEAQSFPKEDVYDACLMSLASRLEARFQPDRDDDPKITMVVGPTGAGKTTSLAKVAGLRRAVERNLAVVTTDAHRYGAELLLRRFSRDLEVPFDVAVSPESLAERSRQFAKRHMFIDTAGRSPGDVNCIPELRALRNALPDQVHVQLVVSATTKEQDLRAQIARFGPLTPDSLIVTKADESSGLTNIVNLLLDEDAPPLSWFGIGQKVPGDLRVPDPTELAEGVLGAAA
ncbi:MAG: hypothetical protein GY723_04650 [bacterium]|nr:hypothetical protein [bacterium]MCP5067383.1 hypothetical protein [bacterium]